MAGAIYEDEEDNMIQGLVDGGCSDYAVRYWQARTSSNGFQGAILENDQEVVCAFKGSKGGKSFVQDWLINDMQIAINLVPSQSLSAAEMVAAAETICGGSANRSKPLSLVGHSLGGGLAQLVGYLRGAPFVTFNAPGMLGNIELVPFLYRGTKPGGPVQGFNMILWTDPIGNYGRHIGKTERFMTPGAFNPFGGAAVIAHQMGNVMAVLDRKPDWAWKALDELV
jgi:hypothetical protein